MKHRKGVVLKDKPFTTDGCSGGMSILQQANFQRNPQWEDCCSTHDYAYWKGGSSLDRKNADIALRECVTNKGHPFWAWIIWIGVRIGGVPWLPTPWRWDYGTDFNRSGYSSIKRDRSSNLE